jgi:glycerol-3-phosphate acyltransferase PlsY
MNLNFLLALLLTYLLGSIPFSQIVGRLVKGIDLRKTGTHNVGGVNLIRNAGAGWGALGGGLDILKGTAAMWMAQIFFKVPAPLFLLAGPAVVAGHIWSIFLGFRGGKGIATTWGVLAWVAWPAGLIVAAVYGLVHWPTRNGTTACIVAFSAAGIYFFFVHAPLAYYLLVVGLVLLILLASLDDLTNTAKTANVSGSWLDNFITPKSTVNKKPSAPKRG